MWRTFSSFCTTILIGDFVLENLAPKVCLGQESGGFHFCAIATGFAGDEFLHNFMVARASQFVTARENIGHDGQCNHRGLLFRGLGNPASFDLYVFEAMSEADEQRAVIDYCTLKHTPIYHIPNGGYRNKAEAAHLKAQGVMPGVPDLCIPVARGGFHSLYIEMKTKGGRVSDNQSKWLRLLRDQGMCAYVCYGADAAISLIDLYMAGKINL